MSSDRYHLLLRCCKHSEGHTVVQTERHNLERKGLLKTRIPMALISPLDRTTRVSNEENVQDLEKAWLELPQPKHIAFRKEWAPHGYERFPRGQGSAMFHALSLMVSLGSNA